MSKRPKDNSSERELVVQLRFVAYIKSEELKTMSNTHIQSNKEQKRVSYKLKVLLLYKYKV